ncbi:hypothetical protein Q7P37_010049 [Cladosporium fusiforme]
MLDEVVGFWGHWFVLRDITREDYFQWDGAKQSATIDMPQRAERAVSSSETGYSPIERSRAFPPPPASQLQDPFRGRWEQYKNRTEKTRKKKYNAAQTVAVNPNRCLHTNRTQHPAYLTS